KSALVVFANKKQLFKNTNCAYKKKSALVVFANKNAKQKITLLKTSPKNYGRSTTIKPNRHFRQKKPIHVEVLMKRTELVKELNG
ncbi:10390_t:CDS:1, partial [Racocetra persica]